MVEAFLDLLRISYLVPTSKLSGGIRVILMQAKELARRGHEVTLVSPDPPPTWFDIGCARWERAAFEASVFLGQSQIVVATFWTTVEPALRRATGPVFHLCQGYEASFSFYARDQERIRAAYNLPTRKLVVSPHLMEQLASDGISPIAMVGQVFDPTEFTVPADRRFDNQPLEVLLVGAFEADVKGIPESLQAVRSLRDRRMVFRLRRISTEPPGNEELSMSVADRHDVNLSPAEMASAYQTADILIGPSHREEGFGLPVLEGLSCGLPALLSNTPSHRSIAGSAAIYYPEGRWMALAEGLQGLIRNATLRRDLSVRGPLEAKRFSTDAVADRLLDEFRAALPGSG